MTSQVEAQNVIKLRNLHAIFRQKDAELAKNVPVVNDSKLNELSKNVAENLIPVIFSREKWR